MAETTVFYRFLLRAYTAVEWLTSRANDLLKDRELGVERDTYRTKFGDGSTPVKDLSYVVLGLGKVNFADLADGYVPQWDDVNSEWRFVQFGSGGQVPTYVAEGDSFYVLPNRQVLFLEPIVVDGELKIDGVLIGL